MRARASIAPSECFVSWVIVSCARRVLAHDEDLEGDGGVAGEGTSGERGDPLRSSWSWRARKVRDDVKTNAVVPRLLEFVLVFVVVVARIGLQSSRLMNVGGGDLRLDIVRDALCTRRKHDEDGDARGLQEELTWAAAPGKIGWSPLCGERCGCRGHVQQDMLEFGKSGEGEGEGEGESSRSDRK